MVSERSGTEHDTTQSDFTIKAVSFRCLDESNEWSATDEPYWIFGSAGTAISTPVTTVTRVFCGVDANEVRHFEADEGCICGQNCLPQDLPNEVGSLVSVWEHDFDDPQEIKDGVAIALAAAASVSVASGVAAWVGALEAGVGALIQWL